MKSRTTTKVIGSESSLAAILMELGAGERTPPRQPDEFTREEVMEDRQWEISKAARFLNDCVKKGTLTRRRFGKVGYLYRKAQ